MMTRDLALGMMRQADTGEQMLTVADAIVGLSEDLNIADAAAHFEQLNDEDPASVCYVSGDIEGDDPDYETEMLAQQA